MQYHVGQFVMYRSRGICRIENIGKVHFRTKIEGDYYTLRPPFTTSDERIYIPVNADAHMRRVMTPGEARMYLERLREMEVKPFSPKVTTQLVAHYQELLQTGGIEGRLQLFKEVCRKEALARASRKNFGEVDRKFKNKIEQLLSEELSIALNEPLDRAKERLYAALQSRP